MTHNLFMKAAVTSLIIGTSLTGCKAGGEKMSASASHKSVSAKAGPGAAKKATKYLAKGQNSRAIGYAERAVLASPNNAEYRALLGQVYVANGRFVSAERSFQDALELGNDNARNVVSLALSQIAQGKVEKAKRNLRANRRLIPASDYGLALALAGDTKAGVDVLVEAIRQSDATVKTRQNLALAYALNGQWREAKVMAMRDMSPQVVDQRIMDWARMTRPGAYQTRVSTLLGVAPAADGGQPVQLALATTPAVASPQKDFQTEVASFDTKQSLAPVGPAPKAGEQKTFAAAERNVSMAAASAPLIKAETKPVKTVPLPASKPVAKPAKSSVAIMAAKMAKPATKPAPTPVVKKAEFSRKASAPVFVVEKQKAPARFRKAAFTKPARITVSKSNASTHMVQLGAFSSAANAKRAWSILSKRHKTLAAFGYNSSTVRSKGRTLYRLSAVGFGNAQSAKSICNGLKSRGASCIVRSATTRSPTQMVRKKKPALIASR